MGKILVIGSVVADIIIRVDHLPSRSEDIHVISQEMRLGGCAFNSFDMIRHFGEAAIPFFPVGSGLYGDFIRDKLSESGIRSSVPSPDEEDGCCYCFVENDGERTFISNRGAEYRFRDEWFDDPVLDEADFAYICGLEIEEPSAESIVSFLEKRRDLTVFFAPGPRLDRIDRGRMERVLDLSPVLHLNDEESMRFTGTSSVEEAADALFGRTNAPVIVTLGKDGCYYRDNDESGYVSSFRAEQVDTIGAGDSHIGAVIACLHKGLPLRAALENANMVSAKVVETSGALLSDSEFASLELKL